VTRKQTDATEINFLFVPTLRFKPPTIFNIVVVYYILSYFLYRKNGMNRQEMNVRYYHGNCRERHKNLVLRCPTYHPINEYFVTFEVDI
jgi:hypothetical protein